MNLEKFVKDFAGNDAEISKLFGDASYRTFYRVKGDGKNYIVMQMPGGIESASEEISDLKDTEELHYINVQRYLKELSLPVPRIEKISSDEKLIVMEDLGDDVMFQLLLTADDEKINELYKKAIALLVNLQKKTKLENKSCYAFHRTFNEKLLSWELDHFWEYIILARGEKPGSEVKEKFDEFKKEIVNEILKLPTCFVHRDFQSKNLILRNDQLFMIDFQDALIGPFVYDLVALLRDSYIVLSNDLLEELIDYYIENSEYEKADVINAFNLITVHRKMKDSGRFVYIDKVKGNSNYLQYIEDSLNYVSSALQKLPQYNYILEILKPYVMEWRE